MNTKMDIEAVAGLRRRLLDNGFEPVAVATGGKAPVEFGWQRKAPATSARAGALNTGLRCGSVIAADIDIDDPAEVDQVVAAIEDIAGASPLVRFRDSAPRVLIVYRAAEEMKKRILRVGSGKVEFLARGQQFVSHGRHPCGDEFLWREMAPEDVSAAELPAITVEAIDEIGRRLGVEPEVAAVPLQAPPVVERHNELAGRERAWALAALDAVVAEIAGTPQGVRSDTLNKGAFRLGGMVARGWLSEAEAEGTLRAAVSGWTNQPKTLSTLRRGLRDGQATPHPDLGDDDADPAVQERRDRLADELDAATSQAEVAAPMPVADPMDEEWPDELLHPPGLVGEIADWIEGAATRPVRLFAVGAALIAVGALAARQAYAGRRGTGTHLYTLMVGPTASGKDWPQEAVAKILHAAGRPSLITGSFSSAASFISRLRDKPAQVQIIDEIGQILRRLNNNRSSNSENALLEAYCTAWGKNTGMMLTEETTIRDGSAIMRPWISILGATTPTTFRENMRSKNVANGFFNRFLVLQLHRRPPEHEGAMLSDEVPDEIVRRAVALSTAWDLPRDRHTIEQSEQFQSTRSLPELRMIAATDDAEELCRAAKRREEQKLNDADDDPLYEIWSRSAEMVRRVAMILALGRHPESMVACRITADDVRWADAFVCRAMDDFVIELRRHLADTQHQSDQLYVLEIIRASRRLTRRELYRKINGRLEKRTLESVLSALEIGGHIASTSARIGSRGPATTVYSISRA